MAFLPKAGLPKFHLTAKQSGVPSQAEIKNFKGGVEALWNQIHSQSQPRNWSGESKDSMAMRTPKQIANEHKSSVDGGRAEFRAGFYGDDPQLQVTVHGANGVLNVVGNIPDKDPATLIVTFKGVKVIPHTKGFVEKDPITFFGSSQDNWWTIGGYMTASPVQVKEQLAKGGFMPPSDSPKTHQLLDSLAKLVPDPLFHALIGTPREAPPNLQGLVGDIRQVIGKVEPGGTVTKVEIGKVPWGQSSKKSPTPSPVAVDPLPAAKVADSGELGPADFRPLGNDTYLVKTQDSYNAALSALRKGQMLRGVLITPNGDGTSTVKVNQSFPNNVGKGATYIGLLM